MSIPIRRSSALVAALALLAVLPSPVSPALAGAPPVATFNPNLLLVGSDSAAEPSIRTDRLGRSFVIGPTGLAGGCVAFRVTHDGSNSKFIGRPDHSAGGGDCDWAVGPQETSATITPKPTDNDLAYSSLSLANITTGKSDDGGESFGPPNAFSQQVGGDDRMWMAADSKLNSLGFADIFMTYHDVSGPLDIELGVSTDGGFSYVQNAPIINPTDVPPGQWQGLVLGTAGAGNELGNIVARRDPASGQLTLYSIFATPDSPADNTGQAVAGTTNFNRVYEAVGTVMLDTAPPTISWRNLEIAHGPLGARYNRIFPVTAVDAAGKVYAFWSDGNHIDYKTDLTGSGWNPAVAPAQIANPGLNNVAIMPWAQAGASGIADLVFYGASGGKGVQPNPQDDVDNTWNVYMAQTIDGGATWGVFQASDHVIHKGPICIDGLGCNLSNPMRDRTLLDFFQVSIDPTNGAADIAYADDHASPGNSVMYFTRQCTGASATTGAALVNDCVAPPPPPPLPQGTTCPGPQVVDFVGDAPNNYPGGDGSNMDNLDIVNAFFGTPDVNNLKVTLTINNLTAPPPPANLLSALWTVYWNFGTDSSGHPITYFAQATSTGPALFSYFDGTFSNGNFNTTHAIHGVATMGKNGTFVMTVPRADVGSPANGATLTNTFADTHGSFTVNGVGVFYTAPADRAPNSGFGAPYVVGQTCTPPPPPPSCHEADGNGDLHSTGSGKSSFSMDEDQCEDQDNEDVHAQDSSAGMNFQSTRVLSVTFNDALNTLIIYGTGTDNGKPVTFTATAVDNGSTALDTFKLILSDGYSNSGSLLDGTITLH
jgi:hypothetical protein